MCNVETEGITEIITGSFVIKYKHLQNTCAKALQKYRNYSDYRKQPYWALHTHCGKC
jgi:hypothetical protein